MQKNFLIANTYYFYFLNIINLILCIYVLYYNLCIEKKKKFDIFS